MNKLETLDYVCIKWIDAKTEEGWIEVSKIKMNLAIITTLGIRIKENDDLICVASSISIEEDSEQVSNLFFIPKSCVLELEVFSLAKHKKEEVKINAP